MSSQDYLTFRRHINDMSRAASESLMLKGLNRDVSDKILQSTDYGFPDHALQSIDFFKDKFGERAFVDIILQLSHNTVINFGQNHWNVKPLRSYPEWSLEISNQFIDLLKLTPELPPILVPLREIIKNFVPELIPHPPHLNHEFEYSDERFTQTCNQTIIEPFMTTVAQGGLDPTSEIYLRIQQFLKNVVAILVKFMNMNKDQIRQDFRLRPEHARIPCFNNGPCEVRITIQNEFKFWMFPFFERLFQLNKSGENPTFFQNINLNDWIKYGKIQNAFHKALLKKENPKYYRSWGDDWDDWNAEFASLADEQDQMREEQEAEKAKQAAASGKAKGGGRKRHYRRSRTSRRGRTSRHGRTSRRGRSRQ
jgi:hypothetical protein